MINWQQFGLRSNPYAILPLNEGGELPIKEAFVGRTTELQAVKNLFYADSRVCLTVLGEAGVGKTSFANYIKYIFKEERDKPLFSFRREIEIAENLLTKRSLLLEIIGSTLREIKLLDPNLIKKTSLLQRLEKLVYITQSFDISAGISVAGFGGDFGRGVATEYPPTIPMTVLESYFFDLITFIKTKKIAGRQYKGLIVHVNNFDMVLANPNNKKLVLRFFHEIRDMMQTDNVYFLLLGPSFLFAEIIAPERRIKSVFSLFPLIMNPLTKDEVINALNERLAILKSPDVVEPIAPCSNEVIFALYDLYHGDIRSVMSGLTAILSQVTETLVKPLEVDEALLLLGKERWDALQTNKYLTYGKEEILRYFALTDEYVTQKDLSKKLNKVQSNISGYYINPLRDAGVIEVKKQEGKLKYWGLTNDYVPIKFIFKTKQTNQRKIE